MIRPRELDTSTAFKTFFQDLMLERRTAMPGIIKQINQKDGKLVSVDVQPSIQHLIASDNGLTSTPQTLPIIPRVPVILPYSKSLGLSLTIPIVVGDECLLIICDRSLDNWQDNGGVQRPVETTTPRAHELTDAVCILGAMNDTTGIDNYSLTATEIRNADRTVYIRLDDTTITINNGDAVTTLTSSVISHTIGSSSITMNATNIIIDAPTVTISGNQCNINSSQCAVNGDIIFGGEATDQNGINIEEHVHIDSVGGTTGPPEN